MKRYGSAHMVFNYAARFLTLALVLSIFWGCRAPVSPLSPVAVEDRQYAAAEVLFDSGDYDRALAQYRAYVTQYPHRAPAADALMKMAFIYAAGDQYAAAREVYQRVVDNYPESSFAGNARVEILATFYHQGDFSAFFERVGALDEASLPRTVLPRFYTLMGDAYLASGEAKAAVTAYARSLLYTPESQQVEIPQEMKTAIGLLDIPDIEALLGGGDYLPKAYLLYQLGYSCMQAGWDQAALDAFNEFLTRYPDHELVGEVKDLVGVVTQRTAYDRFKVGCLLPLTGPYSSYGNRALSGVELALDRFRQHHPEVPVKLLVKDTASSESQAVAAVRELETAGVVAILGPIIMAKQAAEEAQRIGIPIITLSQKEGITDIGEYVFRNFMTPRTQVQTTVSYLIESLGLKRFAILYPDEKYGTTFMNAFWDEVVDHGGVVTGCESYQGEATDFADPIKKLVGLYYEMPEALKAELVEAARPLPGEVWRLMHPRVFQEGYASDRPWVGEEMVQGGAGAINVFMLGESAEELLSGEGDYRAREDSQPEADVDFDALFIPDSSKKTGLIVPQLAYYDVDDVCFVGTNLWHADELIQMARRYLQNSLLTDGFFAESTLPAVREFVESFGTIYGAQPGFIEAVAYDTAGILFEVVSRQDIISRSAVREKLADGTLFQGVTGATAFLETGEAEKQLYLLRIKGGAFRAVSPR